MSWASFLLGVPKDKQESERLKAENTWLRRRCDDLHSKLVRARAHQEQLKDLRRITCDQRIELYRQGKILEAERGFNRRLRKELAAAQAGKPGE